MGEYDEFCGIMVVIEMRIVLLLGEDLGIVATTFGHTTTMEEELKDFEIGWEWVIFLCIDALVPVYMLCIFFVIIALVMKFLY